MHNNASRKPLDIKIGTVVAISAILRTTQLSLLDAALSDLTGGAPDFFDNEFAIADIGGLDVEDSALDWAGVIALFKTHHINLVGVRNAPAAMEDAILAAGLSLDTSGATREEPVEARPVAAPPVAAPTPAPHAPAASSTSASSGPATASRPAMETMIIDTPVRAGQRVYARGADLVVMAAVNNGAEVIADGSIHVYAPLRGRALAGASGNAQARIFTLSMEAELVSIAGVYRTFENGVQDGLRQQPVQVRAVGDRIDILAIGPSARP